MKDKIRQLITDVFAEQLDGMIDQIGHELSQREDGKMSVAFAVDIHHTPQKLISEGAVSFTRKKVTIEKTALQVDLDQQQIEFPSAEVSTTEDTE